MLSSADSNKLLSILTKFEMRSAGFIIYRYAIALELPSVAGGSGVAAEIDSTSTPFLVLKMSKTGNNVASIKSTQEQLRSDHIGTLELLQQVTKENAALKNELKSIKSKGKAITLSDQPSPPPNSNDGLDLLELVEMNSKQAEEIKMLKLRLSQTELDLMKSKQSHVVIQTKDNKTAIEKSKQKENEMEEAIFDLETHLKIAKEELNQYYGLHAQMNEFQNSSNLNIQKCKQDNYELKEANTVLENKNDALHQQILQLQREHDQIMQDRKVKDAAVDQKIGDYQNQLLHLTEQTGMLKKELSTQVESGYQLQQSNSNVISEMTFAKSFVSVLQTNIAQLNNIIEEQKQIIINLQDEAKSELDASETFKFTAPIQPVFAPSIPPISKPEIQPSPEIDGDASFRFQEFLRLKRENKELKMQLKPKKLH